MVVSEDALLAHNLRTPLAIVLGAAELLLTSDATLPVSDQRKLLTALYVNAEVLRNRIEEQLLGFVGD